MKRKRDRPKSVGPEKALARGAKLLASGEPAAAREVCESVLGAHPTRTDALELRCLVALEERDFAAAKDAIERAIEVGETAKRRVALARALTGLGAHDDADAALRRALKLDPADGTIYEARAELEIARGEGDAALDAAEGAIALTPMRAESHVAKARALLALERSDDAVAAYEDAVRARDGGVRARIRLLEELGALHEARGEDKAAGAVRALAEAMR